VKPQRIQLSRRKGWRLPANTLKVDRSTKWGNPFIVGLVACGCRSVGGCTHGLFNCETAQEAVDLFREWIANGKRRRFMLGELRGSNLACWCPLGQPCHADVLLELANK
jgi:hypothetical protein